MKRIITAFLVAVLSLLRIVCAEAAIEYLTLEKLKDVTGPAEVHVIAKTADPAGNSAGYHTAKTTYQWMIKDETGDYIPSALFVNMDQYESMSISERSFVLNHKEADLTISVSERGSWTVKKVNGVSKPLTWSGMGSVLLIAFLALGGGASLYVFLDKRIQVTGKSISTERKPSKIMLLLALIDHNSGDKKRRQGNDWP